MSPRFLLLSLLIFAFNAFSQEPDLIDQKMQAKLDFMVGTWNVNSSMKSENDSTRPFISGIATIERKAGDRYIYHEFQGELADQREISVITIMNYNSAQKSYYCYFFDHFGGEAGIFRGNWVSDNTLEVTARFDIEGEVSFQQIVWENHSNEEMSVTRKFSDDGEAFRPGPTLVYRRNNS